MQHIASFWSEFVSVNKEYWVETAIFFAAVSLVFAMGIYIFS